MPKTLRGAPSWTDSIQVPADGDLADEASVGQAFQALANSARWLYEQVTSVGVSAVRRVPDVGSLKSVAATADGGVAYVKGYGLYLYVDPLPAAEQLPWVVAPTTGTGRWVSALDALRNAPGGVPLLDARGRLGADRISNGIVQALYAGEGRRTVFSADWADVPDSALSFSAVQAGDVIELDAHVYIGTTAAEKLVFLRAVVGATGLPNIGVGAPAENSSYLIPFPLNYACTAANAAAGPLSIKLQCTGIAPTSATILALWSMRARQVRP